MASVMNRRTFLYGLALGALAAPLAVEGQQAAKIPRIGLIHVGLDHDPPALAALRESLRRLGYEEGRTIRLDYRNLADEDAAHATARAFVHERVDLIVAFENQAVRAAQAATAAVPVLFLHVTDPVAEGFTKSLAHPGGNLTGIADYLGELQGKRLELFKELVPGLRRFLVLTDYTDPSTTRLMDDISHATGQLKVSLVERTATTEADLRRIFSSLKPGEVDAVVIVSPKLITKFPSLILQLSSKRRLPLASHRKEAVREPACRWPSSSSQSRWHSSAPLRADPW